MNKFVLLCVITTSIFYTTNQYNGGSLAPCILAGSVIKNQGIELEKKYPRKKCPVCKGTGKYLSGDGIKMVDCGYCEPEKSDLPLEQSSLDQRKKSPFCKCEDCKCENCQCKPKSVIIIKK